MSCIQFTHSTFQFLTCVPQNTQRDGQQNCQCNAATSIFLDFLVNSNTDNFAKTHVHEIWKKKVNRK